MPPLERAYKIQNKVKKHNFEPQELDTSLNRVEEKFNNLKTCIGEDKEALKKEYGKLMFSLVNLGKILDIEPYEELRKENIDFEARFREYENMYINKNKEGE